MDMVVFKKEVWLILLEPTIESKINKITPCVIISPVIANKYRDTVMIAPLTSTSKNYPSRVNCTFKKKNGQIVIDQIRAVDKIRLIKKLGGIDEATSIKIYDVIKLYFSIVKK
jgi:mRNA interferase MazF